MKIASQPCARLMRVAWCRATALLLLVTVCGQASAQIPKVNDNLNTVMQVLTGAAVIVFTVFIIKAGIEVGSHNRKLIDIWPIVIGAAISGSAAVIAALMIN